MSNALILSLDLIPLLNTNPYREEHFLPNIYLTAFFSELSKPTLLIFKSTLVRLHLLLVIIQLCTITGPLLLKFGL